MHMTCGLVGRFFQTVEPGSFATGSWFQDWDDEAERRSRNEPVNGTIPRPRWNTVVDWMEHTSDTGCPSTTGPVAHESSGPLELSLRGSASEGKQKQLTMSVWASGCVLRWDSVKMW